MAYSGKLVRGWPDGVNNIAGDESVPDSALRDAVNVDILNNGKPRLRAGMTQVVADPGAHSFFASPNFVVWATATTLNVSRNLTKTVVLTNSKLAKPISYVVVNGYIYWSNEDINGRINPSGAYEPWGIATPAQTLVLSAVTGIRQVQVTCAFVTSSGEVSGAPIGVKVLCGDNPIITVTGIPQSSDSRVVATRLYCTELDGRVFYTYADIPAGTVSAFISGHPDIGEPLKTQFMEPPPPGQLLDFNNGVIFIASGSNAFHTDPLRYGLYSPRENWWMFPERITLIRSVDDGFYVSSDGVYFLQGAATDAGQLVPLYPYKAIEGAVCGIPDDIDCLFMTTEGLVRGGKGGAAKNLTSKKIAVDQYERGCLSVMKRDGLYTVVAILLNPTKNTMVSEDFRLIA